MGKSSEAMKNERLVPSAFALRMAGKQQGSAAGEAGAPTALIPLLGISEEKKKGEKPSSDLAEIRNLTMNTLHIQLAGSVSMETATNLCQPQFALQFRKF